MPVGATHHETAGAPLRGEQNADNLARLFALQKYSYAQAPFPAYDERRENLSRLIGLIVANENLLIDAINRDFGNRSRHETLIAEILITLSGIRHTRKHLKNWMRPRGVATPPHMLPARSRIEPQPLGVVGIISPWNYPLQLALAPAAAALAAGNRVLIKPSELTPHLNETLATMIADNFDERCLAVVMGGVAIGEAFAQTPFDHLLFTGSTAVGMRVAAAAAKNLTPVTLELGGKSPAIIDKSADLEAAAASIAYGKMLNAGQTCVAPDYLLAPRESMGAVTDAIERAARRMFPAIDTTNDYTSIISDRHFNRLQALMSDARERGAELIEIGSPNALHPQRKIPLTLIIDPPQDAAVMREEIFGPMLPIFPVDSPEGAISHVNHGDRPLALYWYGADNTARDQVLQKTVSGGVTVNDSLWHVAQENLPFGGVGKSGMGAYHGAAGFETFSHMKPVFYQSRFASSAIMQPPYTKKTERVLAILRKII